MSRKTDMEQRIAEGSFDGGYDAGYKAGLKVLVEARDKRIAELEAELETADIALWAIITGLKNELRAVKGQRDRAHKVLAKLLDESEIADYYCDYCYFDSDEHRHADGCVIQEAQQIIEQAKKSEERDVEES